MKKKSIAIAILISVGMVALPALLRAQGSSSLQVVPGFLSSATTGSLGCNTNGLGNPPCFIPVSPSNPLPTTTSH